jgi:hypothetical protein
MLGIKSFASGSLSLRVVPLAPDQLCCVSASAQFPCVSKAQLNLVTQESASILLGSCLCVRTQEKLASTVCIGSLAARKFGLCSKGAPPGTLYFTFLCCLCCLFCEDCCRVEAGLILSYQIKKL